MKVENGKILVTGGGGFVGSHLVDHLIGTGADVTVTGVSPTIGLRNLSHARGRFRLFELDLVKDDVGLFLKDRQFDFIFHLAASANVMMSVDNPLRDFERNAVATLRLLLAIKENSPRTRMLYTSSAVVYAGGGSGLIKEDDPTVPGSPYGVSKLTAERYVDIFARMYGLRSAVLRLFSVFGPRLRKQLIYDLMRRLRPGPRELRLHGDGDQMRDLSYVSNVVDALVLVASEAPLRGEAYNVASGEQPTIRRLATEIARRMGVNPLIVFSGEARPGDTTHWFADTTRIRDLGYCPRVSLAEGLTKTTEWFLAEDAIEGEAIMPG